MAGGSLRIVPPSTGRSAFEDTRELRSPPWMTSATVCREEATSARLWGCDLGDPYYAVSPNAVWLRNIEPPGAFATHFEGVERMGGLLGTSPHVTCEVDAPEEKVSLLRVEPHELHLRGVSRALRAIAAQG